LLSHAKVSKNGRGRLVVESISQLLSIAVSLFDAFARGQITGASLDGCYPAFRPAGASVVVAAIGRLLAVGIVGAVQLYVGLIRTQIIDCPAQQQR
jgi:hypothetical protein